MVPSLALRACVVAFASILTAMRVFVYEYTCTAAPAGRPLAPSLRAEGRAMLTAVLHDLRSGAHGLAD